MVKVKHYIGENEEKDESEVIDNRNDVKWHELEEEENINGDIQYVCRKCNLTGSSVEAIKKTDKLNNS